MAAPNFDDPTDLVDCATAPLPTGLERGECYTPEVNTGPIVEIYLGTEGFDDPTDPDDLTPLASEITAAKAADTLIGPLVARVSYTPPTDNTIRVDGQDIPRPADLVANITISNTTQANYDFARTTQKGGRSLRLYGVDANGNWYGGRNGMFGGPGLVVLRANIPEGEDDLQTITGTFKKRGYFDPARGASSVPTLQDVG